MTDGEQIEGATVTVEIDHRVGWSRKIDNRRVANKVTVAEKIVSRLRRHSTSSARSLHSTS